MSIERYKGKNITAEDAKEIIDMPTISDGCKKMEEASKELEELSKKVEELKNICDREALSVNDINMECIIDNYKNYIKDFSKYIHNLSIDISETTERLVNRKQVIFNEEAKKLEQKKDKIQKPKRKKKKEQ